MDWSKAKNLLIIAFVITNIFLIYNIQGEMSKQKETQIIDSKHLNDVEQYLNDNGIKLNTHVPEEIISLPMLMVRYKNFDSNKMAKELLVMDIVKPNFDFSGLKRRFLKTLKN